MAKKYNNTRSFSSADSVLYNGALYPSSTVLMDNGKGIIKDSKIFMDANGQYYTMGDNGKAYPVMLQHDLPEVEVKPSQEEMLSRSLKNSLTLSQDKARVSNPLNPYESFNNHLRERALRGATEHALWDKEHPNLASWRDFATAIPFGVAAAPFAGGLGETALGQTALNGIGRVMANPIVDAANSALGLGMAVEGAKDLKQGKFTPMTLLDLSGAIMPGKSIANYIDKAAKTRSLPKEAKGLSILEDIPTPTVEEISPLGMETTSRQPWELPTEPRRGLPTLTQEENGINIMNDFPESPNDPATDLLDAPDYDIDAALENMRQRRTSSPVSQLSGNTPVSEIPTDAFYNPMENMSDADVQRAYERVIRRVERDKIRARNNGNYISVDDSPLDFVTPSRNTLERYLEQQRDTERALENMANNVSDPIQPTTTSNEIPDFDWSAWDAPTSQRYDALSNNSKKESTIFKPRDLRNGELPYTKEEIEALVNEDGTLKRNVKFAGDSNVNTGAHGKFYHGPGDIYDETTPLEVLKYHLELSDPNNWSGSTNELKNIMQANPTGRSGVLIKTHSGDTSIDSTPLAYMMATRLGKNFKPLKKRKFSFSDEPVYTDERVYSNGYGYNNIFKESKVDADRARALFKSNPDADAKLLTDANGNMTGYELTDENGTFTIPLRSRQEVLDVMNKRLHSFNKHYGTTYEDIVPYSDRYKQDYNPEAPYPWYFGESFDLPNIYGISYKKGGRLCKRRGLTF